MTLQEQWRYSIAKHEGRIISPMMSLAIEVAEKHGTFPKILLGRTQRMALVLARMEFIVRCRALGKSTTAIGKFMSGRDHSTVIHYLRKANGTPRRRKRRVVL